MDFVELDKNFMPLKSYIVKPFPLFILEFNLDENSIREGTPKGCKGVIIPSYIARRT